MKEELKIAFKNKLKQVCKSLIEQRMQATKQAIHDAQEAANNEGKSSAGDKYETSRAMSHLEKEMHLKQMAEIVKELAILHAINVNKICKTIEPGAFVRCDGVSFFIVAGMGKQCVDEQQVYFLSPNAPLAKKLYNSKHGDGLIFNRVEVKIEDVY